jgi:MFS family permease
VRRGCIALGISCGVFGAASAFSACGVVVVLGLAALIHLLGELWESSASWGILFELAPDDAQGQYQGAVVMGRHAAGMVGPTALALAVGRGTSGWLLLGCVFGACRAVVPRVLRERVPVERRADA